MLKSTLALLIAMMSFGLHSLVYADEDFYGTIESKPNGNVGTWVISGRQVEVTDKTELEDDHGPLAEGACVEVEYKNGVTKKIESAKTEKCTQRDKKL